MHKRAIGCQSAAYTSLCACMLSTDLIPARHQFQRGVTHLPVTHRSTMSLSAYLVSNIIDSFKRINTLAGCGMGGCSVNAPAMRPVSQMAAYRRRLHAFGLAEAHATMRALVAQKIPPTAERNCDSASDHQSRMLSSSAGNIISYIFCRYRLKILPKRARFEQKRP
jgi:hypothetical protein